MTNGGRHAFCANCLRRRCNVDFHALRTGLVAWKCPVCFDACPCAACKRKRKPGVSLKKYSFEYSNAVDTSLVSVRSGGLSEHPAILDYAGATASGGPTVIRLTSPNGATKGRLRMHHATVLKVQHPPHVENQESTASRQVAPASRLVMPSSSGAPPTLPAYGSSPYKKGGAHPASTFPMQHGGQTAPHSLGAEAAFDVGRNFQAQLQQRQHAMGQAAAAHGAVPALAGHLLGNGQQRPQGGQYPPQPFVAEGGVVPPQATPQHMRQLSPWGYHQHSFAPAPANQPHWQFSVPPTPRGAGFSQGFSQPMPQLPSGVPSSTGAPGHMAYGMRHMEHPSAASHASHGDHNKFLAGQSQQGHVYPSAQSGGAWETGVHMDAYSTHPQAPGFIQPQQGMLQQSRTLTGDSQHSDGFGGYLWQARAPAHDCAGYPTPQPQKLHNSRAASDYQRRISAAAAAGAAAAAQRPPPGHPAAHSGAYAGELQLHSYRHGTAGSSHPSTGLGAGVGLSSGSGSAFPSPHSFGGQVSGVSSALAGRGQSF